MKILISGTREGVEYVIIKTMINHVIDIYPNESFILLHGNVNGVDKQTNNYVKTLGWQSQSYPPNWKLGKKAGGLRNQDMVNQKPEFGIFIPGPNSIGTYDCLERFKLLNKPYLLYNFNTRTYTIN